MKKDSIGNRMKDNYERRYEVFLTRRTPVMIRLDGKCFSTFLRKEKPFSRRVRDAMVDSAKCVVDEIQGAKLAYVQSDEVSVLVTDYDRFESQAWFDYSLQKMASVSAAVMSAAVMSAAFTLCWGRPAHFDARVFNVPREEVANYFLWRQQDCRRNALFTLAKDYYSAKALHGKNQQEQRRMLEEKCVVFEDLALDWRRGLWIDADCLVRTMPDIREDRAFIESCLVPDEE